MVEVVQGTLKVDTIVIRALPRGAKERLAMVPMPPRIAALPKDERGYPIPKFVQWVDGAPDFRIMQGEYLFECIHRKRCWVCGEPLGRNMTFVVGPMCIVNRTSAEPPSHLECGEYSAKVCPFLAIPEMRRIERGLPEGAEQSGIGIKRNPGVICLWTVRYYNTWNPKEAGGQDGILFKMGEPVRVNWWCEGRSASRDEVTQSLNTGLPQLAAAAAQQQGGTEALQRAVQHCQVYLPT